MQNSIYALALEEKNWLDFLFYKVEKQHLTRSEERSIKDFITEKKYLPLCEAWKQHNFPIHLPEKRIINKEGSAKKRVVYSFPEKENIFLKFISFQLFRYDSYIAKNCYSFRRSHGVMHAVRKISSIPHVDQMYCLKADISNYFNSIDVSILLKQLSFLNEQDGMLFELFEKILFEDRVIERGRIIHEAHGAMAGVPISPFLANIHLREIDRYFLEKEIPYFRYSDDILIFAATENEIKERRDTLFQMIDDLGLSVNQDKVTISLPDEPFEFLGFRFDNSTIDLSDHTLYRMKARIRRKADSLRRWQRKKGLGSEKAAIGFINAMNHKLYGCPDDKEFSWNKWFFPNLTTDRRLKMIDQYMQEYIRYCITGRHYKGNYRITYDMMKKWGYRSLVNEYYKKSATEK